MLNSIEKIRNSKSRLIRVSSEDKSLGTNNKFTVDLASNGGVIDNVKGFVVHSAEVPNVFNNITPLNNNINVSFPGGATETSFTISIPIGYYLIDDLLNLINTLISNLIAINGDTYTLVFSKIGSYPTERILVSVNGVSVGSLYLLNVDNDILLSLGIQSNSNIGPSAFQVNNGVPHVAQYIPNLIGETACYIHSRILGTNNLTEASGTFSVVDKIDLDKPFGSVCYTNYNNDTTHSINYFPFEGKKTIRTIDINLRNREGTELILPPNFNFSMMFKIFYS